MLFDLCHKPTWCGGGATYSYAVDALEPMGVNVVLVADKVGVGVGINALVKEVAAVARLLATHKEHQLMTRSECADLRDAVRD